MSFKFQKILLAIELIVVVAVTLYTGTYAAVDPEKVAVVETAETKKSETVKESESKKASETKKSKETQKKDKKKETEPETKTQQVVENKVKSENKKNSTNNSTTGSKNNNSSMTSGGTASKPGTSSATSSPSAGNNNSSSSGTNHNASAPSGGISSKPNASTPSTTAPSTPQTEAPEPVRPQTPETTHTHNWVESTHEEPREEGHWGEKVIKDAWDEPVYDMVLHWYCNTCGADITADPVGHLETTDCGGYHSDYEPVEIGSVHHGAITEPIWIVDRTWTETVGDGYYVCSSCGATK